MVKAKEQMNISGRKYEDLNAELHQQLPDLYDARVLLFANIVTDISTAENCFYGEMSEVRSSSNIALMTSSVCSFRFEASCC